MNKYEKFYHKTAHRLDYVTQCIASRSGRHSGLWCTIDELIANPAIFPEQTLPLVSRRDWAIEQRETGARFIITAPRIHTGCQFSLVALSGVPTMRYRHINKVWREASE